MGLLWSNSGLVWKGNTHCSATTLVNVLCGKATLGNFGLLLDHFGGCVVEGLLCAVLGLWWMCYFGPLWGRFGGCAAEGLVWAGVLKSQVLKI